MLHQEQSLTVSNLDNETVIPLAYEAMKMLGWDILMAVDNTLLGSTPKSWNKRNQYVLCKVENGQLIVRSEMIYGEILDLGANNKRNIRSFTDAFERARLRAGADIIQQNKNALATLRETSRNKIEREQLEQIETGKAMNLHGSNLYVTYTIIAINLLVFILMAMDGAGVFIPEGTVHIKWGSDFSPLTLSGDWWRLFTSVFIHFGVIHVAMNMYCLLTVGMYLEPLLGKLKYTVAYTCTGILASVISLWWHTGVVNSAGASGAVFGMFGVFLALLSSNLVPKTVREQQLKSIGIFIVYNLVYGMKSGVDNAAHVGGLVSGFLIGMIYVYAIKKEKQEQQPIKWIIPAVLLLTVATAAGYLQTHSVSAATRTKALNELREADYKDNEKFNEKLTEFDSIHTNINKIVSDTSLTNPQLVEKIDGVCYPEWEKATQLIRATSTYDISPAAHARAAKLLQYIQLRQEELPLQKQMAEVGTTEELVGKFNEIREKANKLFEEIVKE